MATYSQKRAWWRDWFGAADRMVALNVNGRYPVRVAEPVVPAVGALERAMLANGYRAPMGPTGSYLNRNIGGTTLPSLHAAGIAIDWDYELNPYLFGVTIDPGFGSDPRFAITEAQVAAVEAIVNVHGEPVWKWLGWGTGRGADTMHFEIDVPPDRLTLYTGDDEMTFAAYVAGWVAGIAEDPTGTEDRFRRLFGERPGSQPQTDYWMAKVANPDDPEWPGFYARRELEFWALASERT